jgi:hypothetical protein
MTWYLLNVFVHIMSSILWVGYLLFWTIIIGPISRRSDTMEADGILRLVNLAPWPPREIPVPRRMRFFQIGWVLLLVLAVTGVILIASKGITPLGIVSGEVFLAPFGQALVVKLLLVVVLLFLQLRLARRPSPRLVYTAMGVTVILVGLSVFLARGTLE